MIETESDFFVNINIGLYFYLLIIFSIALTIKFVLQRRKQDFDFHLAKAYFAVGSQKHDELEEFKYLILLLNAYNRFLEKNIKLEIKDIMRIYPIMISASAEQKIVIRESIGKALEKDKLELAIKLADILGLSDKELVLTKRPLLPNQ